jgi:hypothetical protein
MAYYNKVTGVTVPFIPSDFDWRWQFVPDPITTSVNSSGTAKDTSKTATNSKSSFWDGFGGIVSALTASLPSVLDAFGIGGDKKTDAKVTTASGSAGSAPAGGSSSGSAGAGQNNGSSFNWTTLLLPVIGIVVIVLLITKK